MQHFIIPKRTNNDRGNIEGLPNLVLEAASRGKPVIAGIPGGSKEVIENGETGYVVNGGKIDEIFTHILDLLNDERKVNTLGVMGRRKIEKIITEENMTNSYLRLIKDRKIESLL